MTYCVTVTNIKSNDFHRTTFNVTNLETNISEINADGFFYTPFNKQQNDYDRTGISTSKVSFCKKHIDDDKWFEENKKEKWNLEINSYKPYDCKIPQLTITVICDESLYKRIELSCNTDDQIQIHFEVIKWDKVDEDNDEYNSANARISNIEIRRENGFTKDTLIKFDIKDIENYLIRENCLNHSSGQVAEICKEFAESFRYIPSNINRSDLLDEINSLITSYRYTFHSKLNESDSLKIESYVEKYGFVFNAYVENISAEFEKITDKKEKYEAIRIFNNLWLSKDAQYIFRDGFPIGLGDATSIADEYIKLKYIHSITCERILLDVLISCEIGEYASSAQFNKNISTKALLSIPTGFYRYESILYKDKTIKDVIFETIFTSIFHIIGRIVSGLISWWISGLIAGENETAHIVLFGTMFAADTVLMGLYQNHKLKNDDKAESLKEEHYFNIIRNMCNLHSYTYFMDVKLIRHMLNQLSSSSVKFQHQIFQLISLIESRK